MGLLTALFLLPLAHGQAEDGFTPLFDGATLDGWRGDGVHWSVQDGAIVGQSTPEVPCPKSTYLVLDEREFADFELRLEFRIEGGNSGIQFRSREDAPLDVAGYQADLEDGPTWTGCLYEQYGRGIVAQRGKEVLLGAGDLREERAIGDGEKLLAFVKTHEWNNYTVRARGRTLELEVNGHLMTRVTDDTQLASLSGLFAFQLHAGPPMKVEYRNIRIKEFEQEVAGLESPIEFNGVPLWIWRNANPEGGERVTFTKFFELRGGVKYAQITGSCDNSFSIELNGKTIAESGEWTKPILVDVTKALEAGQNVFTVRATNEGGPAGMWLDLAADFEDGGRTRVMTDPSWRVDGEYAHSFGPYGVGPWGTLQDPKGGEPEVAIAGDKLELPDGFRAERLYSVPKATQGSWVSLCTDDKGRLYTSDQYGGMYRVTPPPIGSQGETVVEPLDIAVGHAQGLLWAFDSLYVVKANGGDPPAGLYRVRDTDGDDMLDDVELLKQLDTGGEHGPHAVRLSPDGKSLFLIAGNHTDLPEGIVKSHVTPVWGEDLLLPRKDDPRGHAVGYMAPGGWVCKLDPDGKNWELYAAGMRNAYDFDFDANGDMFTFDSDMEWDVGSPWYRPTRVLQLVSGADFGWRHGSGKWPAYYADSLPATCDLGLASPTGVAFGLGAKFPKKWRDTLFVADWAYGVVFAVHLKASGTVITGTGEPFISGKPFPVTDLVIGTDGAMYITTGGRRTQSGLYRVTWDQAISPRDGHNMNSDPRSYMSALLDPLHGEASSAANVETIVSNLYQINPRSPFERHTIRTAFESQDTALWRERALQEESPGLALQMLIGLVRVGPTENRAAIIARTEHFLSQELEAMDHLAALRLYALACIRMGAPDDAEQARMSALLEPMLPSGDWRIDRELVRTLVYLDCGAVVPKALARIDAGTTQEEQLFHAFHIRTLASGWTAETRADYFAFLHHARANFNGGASLEQYIDGMIADALENVDPAEHSLYEAATAQAIEAGAPIEPVQFVREWTRSELASALGEVAAGRNFDSGRKAYEQATCHVCHRFVGEGGATGPDLTGAGGRFSATDLLEAILEPHSTISDQYEDTEFLTTDEELFVGRLESESQERLVVRTTDDQRVELHPEDVASRRPHSLSRMPAGLVDTLERAEILNLLAYILTGADPEAPAFRDQ